MADAYYAYTGNINRECQDNLKRYSKSKVSHWSRIPRGDEELLKCRIARFGPVVAG